MEYRFFDIEEAIEDSVANKEEVQRWWEGLGYDVSMSANEWTKVRNFRLQRKSASGVLGTSTNGVKARKPCPATTASKDDAATSNIARRVAWT